MCQKVYSTVYAKKVALDELVRQVTGDEHVPAGQVTFRANIAELDRGDPSDGDARVEVQHRSCAEMEASLTQ